MATYPFKVYGACIGTHQKVFKVKFTKELSSVPSVRAYDNTNTYPTTSTDTTTAYTIFTGSTGNGNVSMLHFLDTSVSGPATQGWHTQSVSGAGVATCLMKGDTSYLQFRITATDMNDGGTPSLHWNALMKVPYDVNPTMSVTHNLVIRYTFTGSMPTVYFYANNQHEGGTALAPVWGTITTDSQGVKFGRATATNTSILASIPLSGQALTRTAWVTES